MGNKTVIVILIAAALLLGFIFFFEKGAMTTSERRERDERVFKTFKQDLVDALEIEGTGGTKVTLSKVASKVDADLSQWEIKSPGEHRADQGEVRSVLSAIDYLIAKRSIKDKEERNKPRFGLSSPRLKASFNMRGQKTSFVIGADASGEAVYMAVDGVEDEFYAVEEAFLESVDRSIDDLRSKNLVEDELLDVVGIKVTGDDADYNLRREKNAPWQIEVEGNWILAASDQIDELIETVNDLKAVGFVKDDADEKSLLSYGLSQGATTIEVQQEGKDNVTLRVGSSCPGESHQVHVVVMEALTVACVDHEFMHVVARPLARLKETRPAVFADNDVSLITLSKSAEELAIARGEDGWQLSDDTEFSVDQNAVTDLLGALRETRAKEIEVGSELVSNLGEPHSRVAIELSSNETVNLAFFKDSATENTLVRRGEEAALLTVPSELLNQIETDTLAFRSRKIANGDQFDIEKLKIEGNLFQELEKKDGTWKLVHPHELAADGMGAKRVAELVAEIQVERFVSKAATREHGLDKPFATITAEFAKEEKEDQVADRTSTKTVVLELGKKVGSGGRFARLGGDDGTVFVVGEEYDSSIMNPLVARDLLQIVDSKVVEMSIGSKSEELVLKKQKSKWTSDVSRNVDITNFERILADLGGVKAIRADSFVDTYPNGHALLTLQIWNEEQKAQQVPTVIKITTKSSDPKENGYLAYAEGIPVVFVLPARIVDDLLSFVVER